MSSFWKPSRRQFLAGLALGGAVLGCGGSAELINTVSGSPPANFSPERVAALEATLDQAFGQLSAPGVIAGVWRGQAAWTSLRGTTTRDGNLPVSYDLFTRVGSITKTMVGTLTLQLVDEGLLGIDDTVERWFPDLPLADQITVRMLGMMSSGIASYTLIDEFTDAYFAHPQQPWEPEQLLEIGFSSPRVFEPGQGFQYCNTSLVMLGRIVEILRGKSLGQALETHLFRPLGMTGSSYPLGLDLPTPYWHGYTLQGTEEGTTTPVDATHWSPTFGAGAGQAISNFHDLRLWARALGTGFSLKPETQRLRMVPNTFSARGGRAYCFAVGVENGWIAHAGSLPGYNTQVAYLPDLDTTIVVMTNSDIEDDDGQVPAVAIFRALASIVAPQGES